MDPSVDPPSANLSSKQTSNRRQRAILVFGLIAIVISLGVRNSTWAHERRLKHLTLDELALAIHDEPNDALTFLYYGDALINAGRAEDSEHAFAHASQLDPKNERAILGVGSAQFRLGKFKEAQASFEKAVSINPKDKEAYLGLAQSLYRLGYAVRATEPLKKIIQLDPNSGPAWYFLGKLYGDSHESDLALDALQHAVKVDPKQGIYWRDLGQLSRHYSRTEEAEEDLKKSIHLSPNDAVAYLWLGQLYLQMGDSPKLRGQAEQCFLSATARDNQMQEAFVGLGQLYQRSGNYSVAAANFRKAVELDASDDIALHYLGECLVHDGKVDEGKKLLAAAAELEAAKREIDYLRKRILADPRNRDLHLRLARVYRKYESNSDALSEYGTYQYLGAEDSAVRAEMNAFEDELIRKGVLPPRPSSKISTQNKKQ